MIFFSIFNRDRDLTAMAGLNLIHFSELGRREADFLFEDAAEIKIVFITAHFRNFLQVQRRFQQKILRFLNTDGIDIVHGRQSESGIKPSAELDVTVKYL
jgi:hypothetical protein